MPLLTLSQSQDQQNAIAEVAWVDRSADQNNILFAQFNGERWISFENPLYVSENALNTVAIGSKPNGEKLLIWTEQKGGRAVLMSMNGSYNRPGDNKANNLVWSPAYEFFGQRLENYAANIVVDTKGLFWVVWSSSSRTQSDIFLQRESDNGWNAVEQVNANNDVPDYHPTALLDSQGNIHVQWTSYDRKAAQYIRRSSLYSIAGHKVKSDMPTDSTDMRFYRSSDTGLTDLTPPDFLPSNARILIHFPSNKLTQSAIR
jgi:hypothetical protein